MRKIFKIFLLVVGTLSLGLGILGIILPLLPTTPLLLLAAYCYARSSERFYQWLLNNRWFGEYIKNYREGRGMPRREKILTLAVLWLTIGFAAVFVVPAWWVRLILLVVACGVTIHLLRIKTHIPPADERPSAGGPSTEQLGFDPE